MSHQPLIPLHAAWFETVLGSMLAVADESELYLLEFATRKGLTKEMARLHARGFATVSGSTPPIDSIQQELEAYFAGTLTQFKTPYRMFGTTFQQEVWRILCDIPYGETRSYQEQAILLARPKAYRAVANANGTNQFAIMIPCHRIIASDGTLGGYGGGLAAKKWLLEHEQRYREI